MSESNKTSKRWHKVRIGLLALQQNLAETFLSLEWWRANCGWGRPMMMRSWMQRQSPCVSVSREERWMNSQKNKRCTWFWSEVGGLERLNEIKEAKVTAGRNHRIKKKSKIYKYKYFWHYIAMLVCVKHYIFWHITSSWADICENIALYVALIHSCISD